MKNRRCVATAILGALLVLPALFARADRARAAPETPAGMILIPAGEFLMGSDEGEKPTNESPVHKVELKAFWIDRYEVTNRRYQRFIDAEGYEKKEYWSEAGWKWLGGVERRVPRDWGIRGELLGKKFPSHPVVGVTWFEAAAFARFEGRRLPTEAEWERAARGTAGRRYPWGDDPKLGLPKDGKAAGTRPVGANPADVSPDGLFDMGGNVSEWTSSWYGGYPGTKFESRFWGEKVRKRIRVARGGSFYAISRGEQSAALRCRTTYRVIKWNPDRARTNIGFRLAMDVAEEGK